MRTIRAGDGCAKEKDAAARIAAAAPRAAALATRHTAEESAIHTHTAVCDPPLVITHRDVAVTARAATGRSSAAANGHGRPCQVKRVRAGRAGERTAASSAAAPTAFCGGGPYVLTSSVDRTCNGANARRVDDEIPVRPGPRDAHRAPVGDREIRVEILSNHCAAGGDVRAISAGAKILEPCGDVHVQRLRLDTCSRARGVVYARANCGLHLSRGAAPAALPDVLNGD